MRISDWSSDVCSSDLLQLGQQAREVPGIVGHADGRAVRKLLRLDEVKRANFTHVEGHLARAVLEQPLCNVCGLWAPGTAIGIDRRGIGIGAAHAAMNGGDGIDRKSTRLNSSQ